jgi:hypothetical protein
MPNAVRLVTDEVVMDNLSQEKQIRRGKMEESISFLKKRNKNFYSFGARPRA